MFETRTLLVLIASCHLLVSSTVTGSESKPADTARTPAQAQKLRVTVSSHARPDLGGSTELLLDDPKQFVMLSDRIQLPFATVLRIHANRARNRNDRREFLVEYLFEGAEDPDRRILVELWAYDAEDQMLCHTWRLTRDGRLGPATLQAGSFPLTVVRQNHVRFEVPCPESRLPRRVEIRFRDMKLSEWHHFRPAPCPIDLIMTPLDAVGRFKISFRNPEGWELQSAKHQVAVSLLVKDAQEKLQKKSVQIVDVRDEGRYLFELQADPGLVPYSSLGVCFYTRQPKNELFVRKFFIEGTGSPYQGDIWHGAGGALLEIPFAE